MSEKKSFWQRLSNPIVIGAVGTGLTTLGSGFGSNELVTVGGALVAVAAYVGRNQIGNAVGSAINKVRKDKENQ